MKKITLPFLLTATACLLGGCGVPKEEYQKVVATLQAKEKELASCQRSLSKSSEDIAALKAANKSLEEKTSALTCKLTEAEEVNKVITEKLGTAKIELTKASTELAAISAAKIAQDNAVEEKAIAELKKLTALVEAGTNYLDYNKQVITAKMEVDAIKDKIKNKGKAAGIGVCLALHVEARSIWSRKIKFGYDFHIPTEESEMLKEKFDLEIDRRDGMLDYKPFDLKELGKIWEKADEYLKKAEAM